MQFKRSKRRLALCLLALFSFACSTEASRQRHFDNGQRHLAADETSEAIIEFRNAVEGDPNWGEARFQLAVAYEAHGRPERAYREYLRAADLLPDDPAAQLKAATYLLMARQFDDAHARAERVLASDPKNIEARLLVGHALVGRRSVDEGIAAVNQAIAIAPARTESYASLAELYVGLGRRADALAAYQVALKVAPRSVEAHVALGNFQRSSGDVEAAEATFKSALAIDAGHLDANRAIADFYIANRRPAEAERHLQVLVGASKAADDHLALADFYIATRRLDEARQILEPMAARLRTSVAAETRLAHIDDLEGNASSADARLKRVLQRSPGDAAALLQKAERSVQARNWTDARWEVNAALAANPQSLQGHYIKAEIELRTRRFADALRSYAEIVRLDPGAVEAKVALSRLHVARNEVESAVLFAEEAVKNAPDNLGARLALVRAWMARGDDTLAESELARLNQQPARSAELFTLGGALSLQRNDAAAARRAFEQALEVEPGSREALTTLVSMEVNAGNVAAARKHVDVAMRIDADDPELLILAAKVSLAAGDIPAAEKLLRRALASDALTMEGYALLARVFLAQKSLAAAAAEFDALAAREPTNITARLIAALAVHTAGNTADAERRYQEILKIDAKTPLAANNLAAIYAERGENLDYAEQLATTALEQQPDAEIFDTLASVQYKRAMYGDAARSLQRAVALQPQNAMFRYRLGLVYVGMSDRERARQSFSEALRLEPRLTEARTALGKLP